MKKSAGVIAAVAFGLWASGGAGQTSSTLCQTEKVVPFADVEEARLIGCGNGYPDDLLWHLDRADSIAGTLDMKTTRPATGKGAVVYVIDTGVMRSHDEFARPDGSNVIGAVHPDPIAIPECPPEQDLAVDPCIVSDATLSRNSHGTGVASIIAGRTTGVAPDAEIVSVPGWESHSTRSGWLNLLDAIVRHAWDPATPQFRTAIINMSYFVDRASKIDPSFAAAFEAKMRQMIDGVDRDGNPDPNGKRFLFVVLAGNYIDREFAETSLTHCDKDMNSNIFPAVLGPSIDGLITVGGIDRTNHLWNQSCRGPAVEILAPAAGMFVASPGGRDHYRSGQVITYPGATGVYHDNSGTSFAMPYVSGLAALLLEKNPNLTPQQIEATLKSTPSHVESIDEPTAGRPGRGFRSPSITTAASSRRPLTSGSASATAPNLAAWAVTISIDSCNTGFSATPASESVRSASADGRSAERPMRRVRR